MRGATATGYRMAPTYNGVLMTEEPKSTQTEENGPSWLAELSDAAVVSGPAATRADADDRFTGLPALERDRPKRPPLISPRVWTILAIAAVAMLLVLAAVVTTTALSRVAVPDVVGVGLGEARTRLERAGLEVEVTEQRFSTEPRDQVLEQDPGPDSQLQKGEVVRLVVSGGSEEFPMPDVVGNGAALAQGTLESRGLVVVVEQVVSEIASDTVLSTTPAAGATVRTGDTVRIQVAASQSPDVTLQPYRFQNFEVVIDAAPTPTGVSDTPMEVARRLRALLEASGASVTMLRSGGASSTLDADRAKAASEADASVAVGFVVVASGQPGRVVSTEGTSITGQASPSEAFASRLVTELTVSAPPVSSASGTSDPVLQAARAPWARVLLGAASVREDENNFSDPAWVDGVARATYAAIGKTFGTPSAP